MITLTCEEGRKGKMRVRNPFAAQVWTRMSTFPVGLRLFLLPLLWAKELLLSCYDYALLAESTKTSPKKDRRIEKLILPHSESTQKKTD